MAGNFFGGEFFGGGFFGAISPSIATTPSGVSRRGRKRELLVSLRDVQNKESIADFLKSQLRKHVPEIPDESAPVVKAKKRGYKIDPLSEAAMRGMEIERQEQLRKQQNNAIIAILLMSQQ